MSDAKNVNEESENGEETIKIEPLTDLTGKLMSYLSEECIIAIFGYNELKNIVIYDTLSNL